MKKLAKILLAAGIIFSLPASSFAAEIETEPDGKFNFKYESAETEQPEFLVKGVVKDITQKILPISVEARYFAPHFDLTAHNDKYSYNGGEIGLKNTLGFSNDKAPEVIFRYKRFTADYFTVHGAGSKNFGSNPLTFGGDNYYGDVNSQSDLHYLKLQITNPIVSVLGSGVDWSYGLTGIYWKGTASGSDAAGNYISNKKEFGAPIPTLGVGAHASLLDMLIFNVHLSGLPLGGNGHFYDFEAGLRYNPIDLVSISLGYRKIHANLKHKDNSGTFDLDGPYAGVRVDF